MPIGDYKPVPKPKRGKKIKKVNGYKNKWKRVCVFCGTNGAERHEVYGGSNRQISIDYGFQIDLCSECHRNMHNPPDIIWEHRREFYRQKFQADYEKKLVGAGIDPETARDLWLKLIGKNYLPR